MLWTQLKTIAAVVLVASTLLAAGAGVAAVHAGKGQGDDRPARGPEDRADRAQVVRTLCFDNYNLVPGETTIISILPANVMVKRGQLVCLLDPARIKDRLANQKTTTRAAEAALRSAKLTREVAEIAVIEYVEGIYKQDLDTVDGEIKLAESDLSRQDDRVEWARRMFDKGHLSKDQKVSEELALKKARFSLEQSQSKRKVLVEYTRIKTIKELKSEVEKARADELATKATCELETAKTEHLERDIARCKMKAPADGELILAPGVEKGATVREHQLIFRVLTEIRAEPRR